MAIAIVSAIIGAVVGAAITWLLTPNYSAELSALREQVASFQRQMDVLEQERRRRAELSGFSPSAEIAGQLPEGQFLKLKASLEFTLKRLDYLADNDAMVTYDEFDLSGSEVEAPIDNTKIVQIHNLQPRTGSHPIPMKFRCRLLVDGQQKTHLVEALIKPEIKTIKGTSTYCLTVVGGL